MPQGLSGPLPYGALAPFLLRGGLVWGLGGVGMGLGVLFFLEPERTSAGQSNTLSNMVTKNQRFLCNHI